jgi:hypothetical protein
MNWQMLPRASVSLLLLTLLNSCASSSPLGPVHGMDDGLGFTSGTFRRLVDHEEDNWNPLGIWKKASDDPPTYRPTDMPASVPLHESRGTWFIDASDGYRFFVPRGGTAKYTEGLLKGEAAKITNRRTRTGNTARNAVRGLGYPAILPMLGFGTASPKE